MRQWLLEDLRLDPHLVSEFNLATIRDCLATGFKRRQLSTLLAVIKGLQRVRQGNTGESSQVLRLLRQSCGLRRHLSPHLSQLAALFLEADTDPPHSFSVKCFCLPD
jgi:hypothetical protein